jgi:photosystem II stability/assembly factor-like uncharacterized protein
VTVLLAATPDGVARTGPVGGVWALGRGLEGEDVRCLATDRATVVAGTDHNGVFRSGDGGRSWEPAGLRGERVRSLAVGQGAIYAGTREPRVHVSGDGGDHWRPLARFSRLRSWWWIQPAEKPYRPSYVSALAVTRQGTLIAGIEACGVLRSADGGESWSGHRPRALRDCHELHAVGDRVYEVGAGGLAVSADDGRGWTRRRAGLRRRYGWSGAIAGRTLYLGVAPYRTAHTRAPKAYVARARGDGAWEACTDELASLPRLAATEEGLVFAALGDGTLLHSADEGRSWDPAPVSLGGPAAALVVAE